MKRFTLPLVIVHFLLLTPFGLAQEPDDPIEQEKYKNGLLPTSTYSGPQTVNLYNGNFIIGIPLFTLPGRAGHDLSIGLSYNSKQLVKEYSGQYKVGRWFYEGPTAGRWIVNTWPSLEVGGPDVYYFTTPGRSRTQTG